MLAWIEAYKELLFSGLGTAVIVFFLGKIFVAKTRSSQKQKTGSSSVSIQAGGDVILGKSEKNE